MAEVGLGVAQPWVSVVGVVTRVVEDIGPKCIRTCGVVGVHLRMKVLPEAKWVGGSISFTTARRPSGNTS